MRRSKTKLDEVAYSPLLDLSEYAEYALRSRIVRYGPEGQAAYSPLLDLSEYAEYARRSRMPSEGRLLLGATRSASNLSEYAEYARRSRIASLACFGLGLGTWRVRRVRGA